MIQRSGKNSSVSGVYVIRCLANGKVYVGSSKDMPARIKQHKSKLLRGEHELPRLQKDWALYGKDLFDFEMHEFPECKIRAVECQYIEELGALEHQSGYNKMIGGKWGPEARIRNIETKYRQGNNYFWLSGVDRDAPIFKSFVQTFCFSR